MILEQNIDFAEQINKLSNVIKKIERNQSAVVKDVMSIDENTRNIHMNQEAIFNQLDQLNSSSRSSQGHLDSCLSSLKEIKSDNLILHERGTALNTKVDSLQRILSKPDYLNTKPDDQSYVKVSASARNPVNGIILKKLYTHAINVMQLLLMLPS